MAFLIGGANSAADTAYDIDNSLRFPGESAELTREQDAGNRKTWTCSVWTKIFPTTGGSLWGTPSEGDQLYFSSNKLYFFNEGSSGSYLSTDRLFRDPSAWYHLVIAYDTTQGTAANRVKLYINGSQYTWDDDTTYPDEDDEFKVCNDGDNFRINAGHANVASGGSQYYYADFAFIDGTAYDADDFGKTDDDSGIWKPKDVSGLTFGTNGFLLEFKQSGTSQNSSGMGADTSGNDNHFAVTDLTSVDQTTDTPTNNFATFNSLYVPTANPAVYTEGNTKAVTAAVSGNTNFGGATTIGMSNGKWYCEFKVTIDDSSYTNGRTTVGITSNPAEDARNHNQGGVGGAWSYTYNSYNGQTRNNGSDSAYGDVYDDNDIISIALDLDNNKLYFAKNGTWQNSGDPTTGATGTGAISITALGSGEAYHFQHSGNTSSATISTAEANFGNPAYANSSDAADAAGYGAFEYAPPSGYYALCTKNLAEYG